MRSFSTLLMVVLYMCAGAARADAPKAPVYDAADFFETTDYIIPESHRAFSPDGSKLLVSANPTGVFNVFELDVLTGEKRMLTHSASDAMNAIGYFKDGERFLFTADQGGNELNHVYVGTPGGEVTDLTPVDGIRAMFLGWDDDDESLVIATNERDERVFDLYRYDPVTFDRKLVYQNDLALEWMILSPNGDYAAGLNTITSGNKEIYLMTLSEPQPARKLVDYEGEVLHTLFEFSPDSQVLIYGTDEHGEFTDAWSVNLASGGRKELGAYGWDVMAYAVSPKSKYRIVAVNKDASTDIHAYKGKSAKPLRLKGALPGGELQGVRYSPDGRYAAVFVDSDITPTDVYLIDLKKRQVRQLTDGLNPRIDRSALVEGEVVRFESHGDMEISGVLYRPKGVSSSDPVPALVYAHGGPWGQNRKGYLPAVQYLVNRGYAVLAVNNRGSTGYGKTFFHMDDRHHGDVDLKDMIAARNYLGEQDWVQGDKVGIMGPSYGGYMVMAAMTFAPDEFAVGIDIFGVTNWVRTIESIPVYWESFRGSFLAEMGDPATDGERHRAISPVFHAKNVKNPVLVVQGANDPRVLQAESDDIVAAIRANGVPVEYVLFPDEGHDFKIRANRITAAEAYLNFLETYLPK